MINPRTNFDQSACISEVNKDDFKNRSFAAILYECLIFIAINVYCL